MQTTGWRLAAGLIVIGAAVCLGESSAEHEDFTGGAWHSLERGGVWETAGTNEVRQLDLDQPWKNNGFNRACEQSGVMEYAFSLRVLEGGACGAGIYVLADNPEGIDRGTSYLLWYNEPKDRDPEFSVAKFIKDKRQDWSPKVALPSGKGEWVALRVRIDTKTGQFTIACNGAEVARFEDKSPIQEGNHVSLHTCMSAVAYRDLRISRRTARP